MESTLVQAAAPVVAAAPTSAAVQEAATKASPPADDDDDDDDEEVDLFGEMTEGMLYHFAHWGSPLSGMHCLNCSLSICNSV